MKGIGDVDVGHEFQLRGQGMRNFVAQSAVVLQPAVDAQPHFHAIAERVEVDVRRAGFDGAPQ